MATMAIEDFKLQPIREQVEYLYNKLEKDTSWSNFSKNSDEDFIWLKELAKDIKYRDMLKSMMFGTKRCNNISDWDEFKSNKIENKEYLLNTIMNQLGLTDEDLDQDTSWIKAKVRESNIDKVLNK